MVVVISEEVPVQDDDDNIVAYVVGCLLGAVVIIIMIGLLICLVHIYRNRIKYHGDTFVSSLYIYNSLGLPTQPKCRL